MKKLGGALLAAAVLAAGALLLLDKAPAVFQRGNPVPYLAAAAQLGEEEPFAYVGEEAGRAVYIADAGDCEALVEHVESEYGASFIEQAGAAYLFAHGEDGEERLVAQSELYWGRWVVWEVPLSASS